MSISNVTNSVLTDGILSFISSLDSYGASQWSYRYVAVYPALLFILVRYFFGKTSGVYWHGFLHALIVGNGALLCLYLDFFAAESMTGTSEPLRMIQCMGPLTNLHRLLPAFSLGYSLCEILDGLALGGDYLIHGLAFGAVMILVCELNVQHTITQMLIMEVSTIFLNLFHLESFGEMFQIVMQLFFALTFSSIRLIVVPYCWGLFVVTFYNNAATSQNKQEAPCFPHYFIYVVIIFGVFFHSLNFYWFVKIFQKAMRKLKGTEKMSNIKKD